VSDYLTDNSLLLGGPLVAGSAQTFDPLVAILGEAAAPPTLGVATPATP
jgi:uncharacterized membrane protein